MRRRGVVIGGVLLAVAIATTALVITSGCRYSAKEDSCPEDWISPGMRTVLVATRAVQPGQEVDDLLEDGGITENMVPLETLVDGAARDVSQIEGRTVTRSIESNEQISVKKLSTRGPG